MGINTVCCFNKSLLIYIIIKKELMGVVLFLIAAWGGVHFSQDAVFLVYIIVLFPLVHESCNLLG